MRKTIGIMTIHTTYNYGAVLQAYASEAFFNERGYQAELIDYTNPHIQEMLKLSYRQDGKLSGYLVTFLRNTLFGRLRYYQMGFGHLHEICRFSQKKYEDREALQSAEYDIMVAGSDQLWNPIICGELDPAFFLQYGHAKKRISMASSLGSSLLNEGDRTSIRKYLTAFDHISVREVFAKKQLESLTEKEIKILLDPTLLLTQKHWREQIASRSSYAEKKEHYIVTYFAGGDKGAHRQIIARYAEKLHLPVWTIQYSNYTWPESSKKILGATMEDFVALIANADLVITDSFHGVAFSVNLNTDFVALTNKANPVRVKSFLDQLGISERIDMMPEKYKPVDYENVQPKLDVLREDSIQWLLNSIES